MAWQPLHSPPPLSRIVIIGSGLSMADQVQWILRSGHQGPILSLSCRGLLPCNHAATKPLQLVAKDLLLGTPVSALLRWVRGLARFSEAQGGAWRDAVDGIRAHIRTLCRALPTPERARFLRHAATWWDGHLHRIPPQSLATLDQAISLGQLTTRKVTFQNAEAQPDGDFLANARPFRTSQTEAIRASRIVDCRGIRRDPEHHASPLVANLLAKGTAPIDLLRIGRDGDEHGRLIRQDGAASPRIQVIGPASHTAFLEITAIPDIREPVAQLAGAMAHE